MTTISIQLSRTPDLTPCAHCAAKLPESLGITVMSDNAPLCNACAEKASPTLQAIAEMSRNAIFSLAYHYELEVG